MKRSFLALLLIPMFAAVAAAQAPAGDAAAGKAPQGQVLALSTIGCARSHPPVLDTPRRGIAEANGDFEWFKHMVYDHTKAMPEHCAAVGEGNPYCRAVRMGDYSRTRLSEDMLKQVYDWALSLGLEIPVTTSI